jgi:hypothetical protein
MEAIGFHVDYWTRGSREEAELMSAHISVLQNSFSMIIYPQCPFILHTFRNLARFPNAILNPYHPSSIL